MTAVSDEPALRFWLQYAEREGALVEADGARALLVLPPKLQASSELPEEVVVTADSDLAREEDAVLLIPGHPALERAAASLLADGDTGHAYLPWPGSRPPGRAALEERARELVAVEHGRIDAAGEPTPAYVPLLRAGAMISYSASLTLRFGEQEEAWVDARTGLQPSERLLGALRGAPRLPGPDQRHRVLPAELSLALASAHSQLSTRAIARQASLALHARRTLESELARADAYYHGALESIDRRRSTADGDRARLLDAQADATKAEHARRRREIEQEYQAHHEIRPFRLHLVHVPAFVLPIDVRRGSRRFPSALTWLPMANEFAAVRCPACGAPEPLVAARDALGCESCKPSGVRCAAAPPPRIVLGDAASSHATAAKPSRPSPRPHRAGPPAERPRRPPSSRPSSHDNVERTGNKLALTFWQQVASADRWPRSKAAPQSPLRAAYRLYGQAGPLCAIGAPPDQLPYEVTASTYPTEPGSQQQTIGAVSIGGVGYRFALGWYLQVGKPVICEVSPSPHPLALPPARGETGERLRRGAPPPTIELDPVASTLWRAELDCSGLPFLVRCLATWWRVQDQADIGEPAGAIAAAISGAVARAAGMRRTKAQAAATYETDVAAPARATQALGGALRLDRARGW